MSTDLQEQEQEDTPIAVQSGMFEGVWFVVVFILEFCWETTVTIVELIVSAFVWVIEAIAS